MTTRYLLAGLLGGIAMFAWSFVAHMLLPLGDAGVDRLPNEQAVMDTLQTNLGDKPGFFFYPAPDVSPDATAQQRQEAMNKMAETYGKNPHGILVYHPAEPFAFGRQLGVEFAKEVFVSILALLLLMETKISSFQGRVCFVTTAGILAAVTTSVSYWNWFSFPAKYTSANMFTTIVGFLCAGLAAALVLRKTPPHP